MDKRSNRSRLISKIHAQKNAAGLDDATYRIIIAQKTGKESCSECNMQELKTIFENLNIVLQTLGKQTFRYYPRWEQPTLKDAVTARAKKILGEDWQNRLDSFSQTRFSKAKYILCTNAELRSIMAFLTNVERKERVAK
ncbi:MAG: DUF1018 domain-containing protein [Treponema sp.]|nr:DUF1018 domain-containing protein [Treponema sp.]